MLALAELIRWELMTFYLTGDLMYSRGSSVCGSSATHLVKVVLEPRTKAQATSASCFGLMNVEQTSYLPVRQPLLYLISSGVTGLLLLAVEVG